METFIFDEVAFKGPILHFKVKRPISIAGTVCIFIFPINICSNCFYMVQLNQKDIFSKISHDFNYIEPCLVLFQIFSTIRLRRAVRKTRPKVYLM